MLFKLSVNRSLRFRLTTLITALTGLITLSFATYFIYHERSLVTAQLRNEGELLASLIATEVRTPLYAGSREETAWHTAKLSKSGSINSVIITDANGEVVVNCSRSGSEQRSKGLLIRKDIISGENERSPQDLLLGDQSPPGIIGRVELVMDTGRIALMTRRLIYISIVLAVAFWYAASRIAFFFMNRITSTFQTLMTAVRRIEEGDLSQRVAVTDNDEPGRALAAINNLADSLRKKGEENERLQAEVVKGLRLQIDEEKTRNMAKLIQTNRMTSLGLLVSSMAHEINNPNGAIRLASEILEKGLKDVRPVLNEFAEHEGDFKLCGMPYSAAIVDIEKAVEAISRSSIRIEQVVRNLRSYSIGDREHELMSFDLNRVAENSVGIVMAHGRMENITITTRFSPECPNAIGNPFQTEQVIINLLMNAIQAMSINGGKTITISTEKDPESREPLLHVTDSGPGVPEENMPHIFEPFYSTRIDKGGSGLGLYISEFIIREQKGTLKLENIEGGGCRATIRLPAAENANP